MNTNVGLFPADGSFPARRSAALAAIDIDAAAAVGVFRSWDARAFGPEEVARCWHGQEHDAPGSDCDCGFRGADTAADLLDGLNPSLEFLSGVALLDVELGGFVVRDRHGFRGGAQRVREARLLRWCRWCVRNEVSRPAAAHLYALRNGATHEVLAACDHHISGQIDPLELSIPDITDLVGVATRWASVAEGEQLRWHQEQRWSAPQQRGPALHERTVRQLRMGQLAFVAPQAIRLDQHGHLWAHRDAAAPQRPQGTAVTPVRRSVDLALELVATTMTVRELDGWFAHPRPRRSRAREERISVIRGSRHLPLLTEKVIR